MVSCISDNYMSFSFAFYYSLFNGGLMSFCGRDLLNLGGEFINKITDSQNDKNQPSRIKH